MVQHGEKTGSIDAHQPISPRTTECRMIQRVIVAPFFERVHALADRAVLHRRNPKTLERLSASCLFIDKAENQFTLAPGVAGIYQLGHIGTVHKLFENGKLLFLAGGQRIFPVLRQNRQIFVSPLFETLVIAACVGHTHQMSNAPGHQQPVALYVAVFLLLCPKSTRNGLCNRGLFTDNQNTHSLSSCSSACNGTLPSAP